MRYLAIGFVTFSLCFALGCDRSNSASSEAAVNPDCDDPEHLVESEVAALSNVEMYRSPVDIEGARVVGCIHNRTDDPIETLSLYYREIDGGSFGGKSLEFANLEPEEATPFYTDVFDGGKYGSEAGGGLEIVSVGFGMSDTYDLSSRIKIDPAMERPKHDLESTCAELDPEDGEEDIWLSEAKFESVTLLDEPAHYVVGCVTNRSDESIATDDLIIGDGYQIDARHNYATGGGVGNMVVEEPIEPGESAFFVYDALSRADVDDATLEPVIDGTSGSRVEIH